MSVDMYVSSSQSQASSVAAICRQQKQGYEQLQRAINDFVVGSPQLQGAAYDSAKQFFSTVLIPLSKGGILLSEAVMEACQKFPEEYMAAVDSGDLRESDLREKIEQLNRQMSELSDLQGRLQSMLFRQQQEGALDGSIASRMSGAHSLMATYGRAKQKLQEKLDKLLEFNGRSPDIFAEIDGLKSAVSLGATQVNISWDSGSGSFVLPRGNSMDWATVINESWMKRELCLEEHQKLKAEKALKIIKGYEIEYHSDLEKIEKEWLLKKDGKYLSRNEYEELYSILGEYGDQLDKGLYKIVNMKISRREVLILPGVSGFPQFIDKTWKIVRGINNLHAGSEALKTIGNAPTLIKSNQDQENDYMLGENGTQVTSKTTWKNGKTERVDVENPAPGKRPGDVHYHEGNNIKWRYEPDTGEFVNPKTGEIAPNRIQKKLNDKRIKDGINKGLDVLGHDKTK
ncbi:hypothetical protein [uncultured Vagococcus sp.]|uniref:hypothetical protein n=1 Tax=uncultured Vagococcus sp. TaxID=189676 RepID=UPI0028D08DF2|nr:hypothetical protein [uncultured Vagococcus sp.]